MNEVDRETLQALVNLSRRDALSASQYAEAAWARSRFARIAYNLGRIQLILKEEENNA